MLLQLVLTQDKVVLLVTLSLRSIISPSTFIGTVPRSIGDNAPCTGVKRKRHNQPYDHKKQYDRQSSGREI